MATCPAAEHGEKDDETLFQNKTETLFLKRMLKVAARLFIEHLSEFAGSQEQEP